MGHPKIKEKSGLRPRLPKNIANIKQKAPKGSQRGAPGGPRVAQGLQNGSQILSKFLKKRGLCPGALQKGAKGTPGPPKNIKNEGKLTRTRAQHSQKNRDGEEVFAETRGINRASPSPKIGDGDAPHAMSSEVLSITGTGYLKARWRAGALRPWICSHFANSTYFGLIDSDFRPGCQEKVAFGAEQKTLRECRGLTP